MHFESGQPVERENTTTLQSAHSIRESLELDSSSRSRQWPTYQSNLDFEESH